ncbi:UDP-N-acetyl-D-mannosamine transferase [Geitlerinema sp. FC II]|nr:UDP-N-acetyl-D-mannosamine transferase [Geitlerinema sp. FC II]
MSQVLSPRFAFNPTHPFKPSVSATQRELIDLVRSKLDAGEYRLHPTTCPCGAEKNDALLSEIDRYGLPFKSVLCLSCGTVRIDPYLDEASLGDFYTHTYRRMYGMDLEEGTYDSYFASQRSYAEKILATVGDELPEGGWVCEVGCGGGGALKTIQDRGFHVAGCDYDTTVMELGKQNGVANLFYGSIDAIGNAMPEVKFDLIYLHHVFEHLTDPVAFLNQCRNFLNPNGQILVIVPDIYHIDEIGHPAAVGNLLMYLHVAHKYNFSIEGVQRLASRAGYCAEKVVPDAELETPWSKSPELWVKLCLAAATGENTTSEPVGTRYLKYLKRTESLYGMGLCKGQIANKLETLTSPDRLWHKVKRVFAR